MDVELKDSIIVFLDILGFKKLLENLEDFKNLFSVIKNISEQNTKESKIQYRSNGHGSHLREAMPAMTSFSDCIVLSVSLEDIKKPFVGTRRTVEILLSLIQQLTDSLMIGGYILRGGMTKGDLYHKDGVVFGKALIEAYDLEKTKAKVPRILVSDDLAKEYNADNNTRENYLLKDNLNTEKEEYCLDYLKFSFQCKEVRERYRSVTKNALIKLNKDILEKINKGNLTQIQEYIKILEKWIYFKSYVEKSIDRYEAVAIES